MKMAMTIFLRQPARCGNASRAAAKKAMKGGVRATRPPLNEGVRLGRLTVGVASRASGEITKNLSNGP